MRQHLSAASLLLFALSLSAFAQEPAKRLLKEPLTVTDLQGGFAGFTGTEITIDTDGKWQEKSVGPRNKTKVLRSGAFTRDDLKKLAEAFKAYGPASLKDAGKATGANPRVLTIRLGKKEAKLTLPAGSELPKADAKTMEGRFAGVVQALKAALPKEKTRPGR